MASKIPYRNRSEAGRLLAGELMDYRARPGVLLLGVARGGVPVADEVASALDVPLGALVVRKLEAPTEPGLTMGALAPDGVQVLDQNLIRALGISKAAVESVVRRENAELERCQRLYGGQGFYWKHRTVILVDDAAESGWTMLAALHFARKQHPHEIVTAVPWLRRMRWRDSVTKPTGRFAWPSAKYLPPSRIGTGAFLRRPRVKWCSYWRGAALRRTNERPGPQ